MVITGLETLGRGRIKITLDNSLIFVIYKGEVTDLPLGGIKRLEEGMEFTDEAYEYVMTSILPKRAKIRAMNILMKNDKTERQLADKLREGFYPQDIIDSAIEYVKSYGYVDDRRYAMNYAEYRVSSKSRRQIETALLGKGINKDIISDVLDELYESSDVDEGEIIRKLALKKAKGTLPEDEKEKQKLFRYLMGKGYSYEQIRRALAD